MKALVRTGLGAGEFSYEDIPMPAIKDDQALVRVKAVGVCGTDYHMWTGGVATKVPVVVGHEFCGIVEVVGKEVTNVSVGDKVVSRLNIGVCGVCRPCITGNPHMCVHRQCPGFKINGAYGEYIAMEQKQLIKLSDTVSFEEGALTEPMAIVAHALLERTTVEAEDVVVVSGPGPIGLIAAQMAYINGASKVIVIGTNVDEAVRLPLAKKLGAYAILNGQKQNVEEEIMKITNGQGADLVVEASGAEAAINMGLKILRRQGRMCILGLPTVEKSNVCWLTAAEKSLSLLFTYSSSPLAWHTVVSMVNRGAIDVKSLISHAYPLEKYKDLFDEIRKGHVIKGVFLP